MTFRDGQTPSRFLDDRAVTPRSIDRDEHFLFGEGDGFGLVLPVKTSAGNPASPTEGQIYVNTGDNAVRVFADAAWRDLVTW